MFPVGYTMLGVLLAGVGLVAWKASHSRGAALRWSLRAAGTLVYLAALPPLVVGVYMLLCAMQTRPEPVYEPLFLGVEYRREVHTEPRPVVVHVVTVDLSAPGVGFTVTPVEPRPMMGRRLRARTVSTFLTEVNAQLAINANYFLPFHARWPWDFYPREGDPVDVVGVSAAQGNQFSRKRWHGATLHISAHNRLSLGKPAGEVFNAVSGKQFILRHGRPVRLQDDEPPNPVLGLGLDKQRRRLILVMADGRQPLYSEGLTIPELAGTLQKHGAHDAVQMDGGGSTALVIQDASGRPRVLNSPIHTRLPGRQRPVANHLGVFAGRIAGSGTVRGRDKEMRR